MNIIVKTNTEVKKLMTVGDLIKILSQYPKDGVLLKLDLDQISLDQDNTQLDQVCDDPKRLEKGVEVKPA